MNNNENNQQAINPTNELNDLNIQETEASEIKGGPIYMNYEGIKGSVHSTQSANAPMPQTREHILLGRQVG